MMRESMQDITGVLTNTQKLALHNELVWQSLMEQLIALRLERGLTQRQVGDLLGVSQASIAQFESSSASPTISRILTYALAVGAKINFSVEDTGPTHTKEQLETARQKSSQRSSKAGPKPSLMDQITPESVHELTDFGPPVGREFF